MGAKEFAEALEPLRRARSEAALTALTDPEPQSGAARLAAALDVLATGVDDEAGAAEQYKPKGWQSLAAALRSTAGKLRELAKELDALDVTPPGERDPKRGIEPGGDPNQPGVAERNPEGFVYRTPDGWPPAADAIAAKLAELETERADRPAGTPLLSDAEAAALLPVLDAPETTDALGIEQVEQLERLAVESGNEVGAPMVAVHATVGAPVSPSAESLAIFSDNGKSPLLDTAHVEARQMLADRRAAAPDGDPFTDPAAPVMLAPPLTFADISKRIEPRADVSHWSYSQLSTLDDCGVKYAATKMMKLPQVPQWSRVGGKALHAAIERIERAILTDDTDTLGTPPEEIWSTAFQNAIMEEAADAPVPPAQWRAASKGAEGFDWWRVRGDEMVKLYADTRRKLINASMSAGVRPRDLLTVVDLPILEAELKIDVPGPMGNVPFVAILDQAWAVYPDDHSPANQILIIDVKSGSRMPGRNETFQLGSQALVLAQHMGLSPDVAAKLIKACYYNARTGLFTEAFNPIERHPYEELVYRVHTAEHARSQGVYRPHVSDWCNGCSVKYACPLVGAS